MAQTLDGVEYLDGAEAAALLRVKKATLYAYVSRGVLRSYKQAVGRSRLYRRDEVERLLAVRPDGALREGRAGYDWSALPDERADQGSASDLPDVASWAGDH